MRFRNFVASKKVVIAPHVHVAAPVQVPVQQPIQQSYSKPLHSIAIYNALTPTLLSVVAAPPAEPLFVTVPPRPQRVLHSEAYIK